MKRQGYTKLLAHHHTGKIRHHKHTSYGSLALILLLTFIPVVCASRAVAYASTDGGGFYETYAVVPGAKPATAPTISNITNGLTFTASDPLLIEGSCPGGTLVKVFKNEILAGAALCQGGSYQMSIDLFVGANSLVARAYNTNDISSPDSEVIGVQLNLPDVIPGVQLGTNAQFYITSEQLHRGANVGETMTWPLILTGGQAPYAVNVSWGDGKSDLISRSSAGRFDVSHAYSKPGGYRGSYTIVAKATDANGNGAYIQLVAIVSGDAQAASIVGGVSSGYSKSAIIRTTWQVLGISTLATFSFWLGEKRVLGLMHRPHYGI